MNPNFSLAERPLNAENQAMTKQDSLFLNLLSIYLSTVFALVDKMELESQSLQKELESVDKPSWTFCVTYLVCVPCSRFLSGISKLCRTIEIYMFYIHNIIMYSENKIFVIFKFKTWGINVSAAWQCLFFYWVWVAICVDVVRRFDLYRPIHAMCYTRQLNC